MVVVLPMLLPGGLVFSLLQVGYRRGPCFFFYIMTEETQWFLGGGGGGEVESLFHPLLVMERDPLSRLFFSSQPEGVDL